jgi:hypothetical protein
MSRNDFWGLLEFIVWSRFVSFRFVSHFTYSVSFRFSVYRFCFASSCFVSFRFVVFRFVSQCFVFVSFLTLQGPYSKSCCHLSNHSDNIFFWCWIQHKKNTRMYDIRCPPWIQHQKEMLSEWLDKWQQLFEYYLCKCRLLWYGFYHGSWLK